MRARDQYGLSWQGKAGARRAARTKSTARLELAPHESVRFEETDHVFIEGDCLDALKLVMADGGGKRAKLIYIDPPYNTGRAFLFADDFDGHSRWLSMMWPRLALAREMLADDGILFASIDDHEVHNLRFLLDEIFGAENFVATVIWQKVHAPKNSARHFSHDHDYIVAYAKDARLWAPRSLPRTAAMQARYANPDGDPRGPWMSDNLSARNFYGAGTYEVTCPSGRVVVGPPKGTYWRISKAKLGELDRDGRIWWGAAGGNVPRLKRFLSEVRGRVPQTLWFHEDVGHTQAAKKELLARVPFASSDSVFDTPKPTKLIERMLRLATDPTGGDLVVDFFAGSGTTGEAVMKMNREDGGNRRFLLVQIPEPTGASDYATIADITKARLRSAAEAWGAGFRVMKVMPRAASSFVRDR